MVLAPALAKGYPVSHNEGSAPEGSRAWTCEVVARSGRCARLCAAFAGGPAGLLPGEMMGVITMADMPAYDRSAVRLTQLSSKSG